MIPDFDSSWLRPPRRIQIDFVDLLCVQRGLKLQVKLQFIEFEAQCCFRDVCQVHLKVHVEGREGVCTPVNVELVEIAGLEEQYNVVSNGVGDIVGDIARPILELVPDLDAYVLDLRPELIVKFCQGLGKVEIAIDNQACISRAFDVTGDARYRKRSTS